MEIDLKAAFVLTIDLDCLDDFIVGLETCKQMEAGSFPFRLAIYEVSWGSCIDTSSSDVSVGVGAVMVAAFTLATTTFNFRRCHNGQWWWGWP